MELRSKWAKPSGRGGADDGLSQALSLVVGPVLFAFVGYLVDQAFGTGPLFLVAFGVLGFFAAVLALYFRYQAAMAREEADKPWNRRQW
ncbi:MAG: AtpZ/AtpI family protein [Acidimicrobiia bacterium]